MSGKLRAIHGGGAAAPAAEGSEGAVAASLTSALRAAPSALGLARGGGPVSPWLSGSGARPGLADLLQESAASILEGRRAELDALRGALREARRLPGVAYVHGPAGIGKSTLLAAWTREVRASGGAVLVLDGAALPSGGGGLVAALASSVAAAEAPNGAAAPVPALPRSRSAGVRSPMAAAAASGAVASALAAAPRPVDGRHPTVGGVVEALNRLAERRGLVLVIDSYDALRGDDPWLRQSLFGAVGPGALLVLAGRPHPAELWRGHLSWRRAVRAIPVEPFDESEATRFVARLGWEDGTLPPPLLALSGGRPFWLSFLVDALMLREHELRESGAPLGHRWPDGIAGAVLHVLEQMLHPGSRRPRWRPEPGGPAEDSWLAAASLLRTFDRDDLTALTGVAGDGAEGAWQRLIDLPFVRPASGRHALDPRVGRILAEAVEHERPWSSRRWRRAALERLLRWAGERTGGRPAGPVWPEIAYLSRDAAWYAALHPEAEAAERWRVARGAGPADRIALLQRSRDWLRPAWDACADDLARVASGLVQVADADPQRFITVRDAAGRMIGCCAVLPLEGAAAAGPGQAGASESQPPAPAVDGRSAVPRVEGRSAVPASIGWPAQPGGSAPALAHPNGCGMAAPGSQGARPAVPLLCLAHVEGRSDSGVAEVLLREVCGDLEGCESAVLMVPERWGRSLGWDALLPRLGFRAVADPPGADRPSPNAVPAFTLWCVQVGSGSAPWLRRVTRAFCPAGAVPPSLWAMAAKEALQSIHDEARLAQTAAGRHFASIRRYRGDAAVRRWLLDALRSADFEPLPVSGRTLLEEYYVHRSGGHETIAERLNLSRATYFRHHRQALERLGAALFS